MSKNRFCCEAEHHLKLKYCSCIFVRVFVTIISLNCIHIVPNLTCSESFTLKEKGTIYSPGYPSWYGPRRFCNYKIDFASDKQVALNFTNANLDSVWDRIFVFDGPDCMSKRIGVLRRTDTPKFISSGKGITALLITEGEEGSWGFKADYSAENCGKELNGTAGNFSYVGKRGSDVLCVWRITVPHGGQVHLSFKRLVLNSFSSWLRVLDGSTCGAKVIAEFSMATYLGGLDVNSTSNVMTIVYSSVRSTDLDVIDAFYSDGNIHSEKSVKPTNSLLPTTERTKTDTAALRSRSHDRTAEFRGIGLQDVTQELNRSVDLFLKKLDDSFAISLDASTTNTVPATTVAVMRSHTGGDATEGNQTNVSLDTTVGVRSTGSQAGTHELTGSVNLLSTTHGESFATTVVNPSYQRVFYVKDNFQSIVL
ncbi:unnamed protein product [Dicrocoelium dendriticum]|nr:unnamed protein product [Dicrocoelium dendriticum]